MPNLDKTRQSKPRLEKSREPLPEQVKPYQAMLKHAKVSKSKTKLRLDNLNQRPGKPRQDKKNH